jgi:ABC-2 type transport system ATP-binding protein
MSKPPIIRTTNLSYHYSKGSQILSDINLNVEKGTIYGFLGPNGSGKTTTLSLLLGLLKKQQGSIEIFGQDFNSNRIEILRKTGSLIEVPSLYGHLTATQNLEIYRPIYGATKERVKEVLKIVGLEDTNKKTAKRFSLGMKQRLAIALALLPNPELLILDEPSNGLDPAGIVELRLLIKKLNRENGMTILISSHLLGEIEKMVTHVGIIYKGKMLFQGALADLNKFQQKGSKILIKTSNNVNALSYLQDFGAEISEDVISIPFHDLGQVSAINKRLAANDVDVHLLQPTERDLEQLFIDLTTERP